MCEPLWVCGGSSSPITVWLLNLEQLIADCSDYVALGHVERIHNSSHGDRVSDDRKVMDAIGEEGLRQSLIVLLIANVEELLLIEQGSRACPPSHVTRIRASVESIVPSVWSQNRRL